MEHSLRQMRLVVASVALLLGLAACADQEPGPRFANNPAPTREATTAASAATPALLPMATPPPIATPSSIADLINTRGAVSHVFLASENGVWAIDSAGDAQRVFEAPPNSEISAIDSAPGAREVAVLIDVAGAPGDARELVIVDLDGEIQGQWSGFEVGSATPVPTGMAAIDVVDWSPQGDRVLVALQSGGLYAVSVADDAVLPVAIGADAGVVVRPAWSPTGEAIGYIAAAAADGPRQLNIVHLNDERTTTAVDPGAGMAVVDFAWMPDGVSLMFTAGGGPGGTVTGIDLWSINADGTDQQLVTSAGTVAPVAQIRTVRPSPDGRSVAYAALVPGEGEPRVDSVWIRDVTTRVGFRIVLPSVTSVEEIWWTDEGLVVAVTTPGSGSGGRPMLALLKLNPAGSMEAIWVAPLGAATPIPGTPVTSAASTPTLP